jgi:hypothetical protein
VSSELQFADKPCGTNRGLEVSASAVRILEGRQEDLGCPWILEQGQGRHDLLTAVVIAVGFLEREHHSLLCLLSAPWRGLADQYEQTVNGMFPAGRIIELCNKLVERLTGWTSTAHHGDDGQCQT